MAEKSPEKSAPPLCATEGDVAVAAVSNTDDGMPAVAAVLVAVVLSNTDEPKDQAFALCCPL